MERKKKKDLIFARTRATFNANKSSALTKERKEFKKKKVEEGFVGEMSMLKGRLMALALFEVSYTMFEVESAAIFFKQ